MPSDPNSEPKATSDPINYWAWTCLGTMLGAIGGPILGLGFLWLMAWVDPNGDPGGPFVMMLGFLLCIPVGAVIGGVGLNLLVARFDPNRQKRPLNPAPPTSESLPPDHPD